MSNKRSKADEAQRQAAGLDKRLEDRPEKDNERKVETDFRQADIDGVKH